MRTSLQVGLTILALYASANLLYFVKSWAGINLFPGHYGGYFPVGDWLWRFTKR